MKTPIKTLCCVWFSLFFYIIYQGFFGLGKGVCLGYVVYAGG